MSESDYRVLFKGEALEGHDIDSVKASLARTFKMDVSRIAPFFSGKTVTLKKGIDHETALKFERVIQKTGARCWVSRDGDGDAALVDARPRPVKTDSVVSDSNMAYPVSFVEPEHEPAVSSGNIAAVRERVSINPMDQIQRGAMLGQRAIGQARDVSGHALEAIRILLTDPIGGQQKSLNSLTHGKALTTGVVFIAFFVLAAFLVERDHWQALSQLTRDYGGVFLRPGDHAKLAMLNLVPPLSLILSFWVINRMAGNMKSHMAYNIHSAGVVLIPSGITLMAFWLFGLGNLELVAVVAFFGMAITIMMVNSALTDVYYIETKKTVLLTPAVVLITIYMSKVLFVALMQRLK